MNPNVYRWCAVPQCKNTSIKTPNKIFVYVPMKKIIRDKWLNLARRDPATVSSNSVIYFCEDHFDLPNDMKNYVQYHVMGTVSKVHMKSGCLPTRFEWQAEKRIQTCDTTEQPCVSKKQRIEGSEKYLAEKSTPKKHVEPASESPVIQTVEHEDGPVTNPKTSDKSVQVYISYKFRSKAVQTEFKVVNQSTST